MIRSKSLQSKTQSGQVLLIVVLIMVIALTIGLSVASRSITDLRTSTEEASSQRAFSAAEAGVERAIKAIQTNTAVTGGEFDQNTKFTTSVTSVSGTEFLLNGAKPIEKDDGSDIWLVDHNLDGSPKFDSGWQTLSGDGFLTLYWGTSSTSCNNSAIEMIAVTGSPSSPRTTRYAFDPCSTRGNNFSPPLASGAGGYLLLNNKFFYKATIFILDSSRGILLRVVPHYFSTPLGVRGCDSSDGRCRALSSQGNVIESTGIAGTTQRKITVIQGFSELPSEFFQYSLFLGN